MNKPASTHEEFRVFDLFSPNDAPDRAPRNADAALPVSRHTHVNPAAARDSFVFTNPLFAPARGASERK